MKRYIFILLAVISLLVVAPASTFAQNSGTCVQFYQVRRGDWLSRIARSFGTTWQYLASINGLANPNRIYAGQILCVMVSYSQPQQTLYVVQRGDWLSRIAQRFGVSLTALLQVNPLMNPNLIYPGQVLVIPTGGVQPYSVQPYSPPANNGAINQPLPYVPPSGGGSVNPPPPNATPEVNG